MNKYLIIVIGVLLTVLFFSIRGCQNARIERDVYIPKDYHGTTLGDK